MYCMLENGIRGGISVILKKYARANNKYMGDTFDPNKTSVFLWYVDATNLYGHAMSQYLPIDNFQWVNGTQDELMRLLLYTPDHGDIGYIACVDLKYPIELHDETNCFPLAPEKFNIKYEQLSGYSKKLGDKLHIPKANVKIAKLAPNLFDKSRYVVHYRNLKYYIHRGMILSEVHHMISFRQSKFMVNYIEETTERRRAATNDFERMYHKLCANSLYGKMAESVRNRIELQIVQTQAGFDRYASQSNLNRVLVYNHHSVGLQMTKLNVELKKPIAVGFTILEHAKYHMYQFHDVMTRELFPHDKINLCYTDTDSFIYEIHTPDLYTKISDIQQEWLNTSNYPKCHARYSLANHGVLGKFKDENPPYDAMPIEFVGLK